MKQDINTYKSYFDKSKKKMLLFFIIYLNL